MAGLRTGLKSTQLPAFAVMTSNANSQRARHEIYSRALLSEGPLELFEVPVMKTSVPLAFVWFLFPWFQLCSQRIFGRERKRETLLM